MPEELNAISPIDGRYYDKLKGLSRYFSEFALIKKRVFVELEYLKELGKGDFLQIHDEFDLKEAEKIKVIEKKTNHDVKASEYYIKEKIPPDIKEFCHYGLTSEDVNNIAYSLLTKEFLENEYHKKINEILNLLHRFSIDNKSVAMLARTHGQAASPTTLGKEIFVYYSRLKEVYSKLQKIRLRGKLNGATGNYNALSVAEPEKDWIGFSRKFIQRLGLEPNLITTQVEPKDSLAELFQNIKRINNIILDLDRDIWMYIMLDYFRLRKKEGEVGSSTMPHKVNPIDFENSEGNLKIANSLFTVFEDLQVSRLQRDLSDSTMLRNIGVAFSHSVLAYDSTLIGLGKLLPNHRRIEDDLVSHPEVLAEAVQTVLRKYRKVNAYEKLKEFTRGERISLEELRRFIDTLDISKREKAALKKLEPKDYVGVAAKLIDKLK